MGRNGSPTTASVGAPGRQPRLGGRLTDRVASRLFGLPPATTGYTVSRRVRVPVRDGVDLAADLYQPNSDVVGTLLVRGPYGRFMPQALGFARVFAARGYNVLFVSSRGTFGSGGTFYPMKNEADAGHDVVGWMVDQPWFSGTFATLGGSYLGHTQWALLEDPPPEMVTAVISVGPHDFSRHAWGTGAYRLDFLGWTYGVVHQEDHGPLLGALRTATNARRVRPALDRLPLTEPAKTLLGGRAPWYADWVSRPDLADPFWAPTQHGGALDRVDIPVLLLGGWQDIFLEQTVEQYQYLHRRGVDVALTVGSWTHLDSAGKAAPVMTRETFDWLEEHLAARAPRRRPSPVHVHVSGAGEWRDLPDWPPRVSSTALYLHPDRSLTPTAPAPGSPPSSFVFDPRNPTPTVGGPLLALRCYADDTELAERSDVLSFTGAPLNSYLEIMGAPVVELAHETDNPHADLFARLSEVDQRGRSHNVTEGYQRLEPGRPAGGVHLVLRPTAHRFAVGSRIRLLIGGGSHPQFARNLGTGENPGTGTKLRPARHTVGHGRNPASCLLLPRVST